MKKRAPLAVSACLLSCLGGCLFGSTSHTNYEGRYVTEEQLHQVDVGTAEAEVQALLGAPTAKSDAGDGKSLWSWHYTRRQKETRHVFLLFASDDEQTWDGTVYVRFDKGHVDKVWRTQS